MESKLVKHLEESEQKTLAAGYRYSDTGWDIYWSKKLNIPQLLVSMFRTKQDFKIAKIWNSDPYFNNTSLDFLLEEEMDKFTNELRITTFRSRAFRFPYKHPIDLLYISKPEGEQFYVLYTDEKSIRSSGKLIFNINGNTNVVLKTDEEDVLLKGKTEEDLFDGEETVSFLPISIEDFLKCCNANHLSVSVRRTNSAIDYEDECDDIIPYFQMLYNKVCDSTMFIENRKQEIKKLFKAQVCDEISHYNEIDKKKRKQEKLNNASPFIIGVIVAILMSLLTLIR